MWVTTNQKFIIERHTKKRKELKNNTKDSHQITIDENKRRRNNNNNNKPTKTTQNN